MCCLNQIIKSLRCILLVNKIEIIANNNHQVKPLRKIIAPRKRMEQTLFQDMWTKDIK